MKREMREMRKKQLAAWRFSFLIRKKPNHDSHALLTRLTVLLTAHAVKTLCIFFKYFFPAILATAASNQVYNKRAGNDEEGRW